MELAIIYAGTISIGESPLNIVCCYQYVGEDILIVITGGTDPHIGAVSMGIPRQSLSNANKISSTVSILTRTGHKDDEIAKVVAHQIAAHFNRNTIVTAGVHIDEAKNEQIEEFMINVKILIKWLKENLT